MSTILYWGDSHYHIGTISSANEMDLYQGWAIFINVTLGKRRNHRCFYFMGSSKIKLIFY
jgi:hypothetical protein